MGKEVYFQDKNFTLLKGDCLKLLNKIKKKSITTIFADPPYRLSNGGITCKGGKAVSVNKGEWDKSQGFEKDYEFTYEWIKRCRKILEPNGTIWITGTVHNIYQVGFALQSLGFNVLNEISWFKPNGPPNLACRYFTHSHETLIWASKSKNSKHKFNYEETKKWDDKINNKGKQTRSVWSIPLTPKSEKKQGKHKTQKPIELLRRVILSSSSKGDRVLDPFNGSGTTGIVANKYGRGYIGIEKEKEFLDLTIRRFKDGG